MRKRVVGRTVMRRMVILVQEKNWGDILSAGNSKGKSQVCLQAVYQYYDELFYLQFLTLLGLCCGTQGLL